MLVSYADMRFSKGDVYLRHGFALSHQSPKNYFWTNGNVLLSRYKCQRHKLEKLFNQKFDKELSENDIMKNRGYVKISDCGNLVFEKIL